MQIYVYDCFAYVRMFTVHMPEVQGGQKRVSVLWNWSCGYCQPPYGCWDLN